MASELQVLFNRATDDVSDDGSYGSNLLAHLSRVGLPAVVGEAKDVRFWRMVLKNSKFAGLRKSRKCSALPISAAARLCRIDTRASDRFCDN
jgi:hypothetical protein